MTSLTEKHGCEIETNAVGFNSNDVIRIYGKDENESRKKNLGEKQRLIVLGFNDMSNLEGHFVSSPREREKRDRRESKGDEREGQGRKRNRSESEETEEIKTKICKMSTREKLSARSISVERVPTEMKDELRRRIAQHTGLLESDIQVEEVPGFHTEQGFSRFKFLLDAKESKFVVQV